MQPYRSKTDLVADEIRLRIRSGEIQPGAVLRQRELAEQFGVSPTPVREALSRLEAQGFVTSEPHRGATVVRREAERVRENYVIRATLEALAAEMAAGRISAETIDALRETNRRLLATGTAAASGGSKGATGPPGLSELNHRFHMLIYDAAGSPLLRSMIDQLWHALDPGPAANRSIVESAAQHDAIVEALARGDAETASGLVRDHILEALD